MKTNYELLAICFSKKSLNGALAVTKTHRDRNRFAKHIFNGKVTKRRITDKERKYGLSKSIIKQLSLIKDMQISMKNTYIIDEKLTLEENLTRCNYSLKEAEREVNKFINYHNIEVLYDRKIGGYYEFRVYKSDKCYIHFNK